MSTTADTRTAVGEEGAGLGVGQDVVLRQPGQDEHVVGHVLKRHVELPYDLVGKLAQARIQTVDKALVEILDGSQRHEQDALIARAREEGLELLCTTNASLTDNTTTA